MRLRIHQRGDHLRAWRRKLLRIAMASFFASWLAIVALTVPLVAHGQSVNLDAYGATASGWAIQPYVLNDEFVNIPAADESTPYVFVKIDNSPSAQAKAAYFYPGTAINAVLNNENAGVQIPSGVNASYPGKGSASSQAGPVSDGVATQIGGAKEVAQASEGSAQASASLVSYQFAPTPGTPPPVGGGVPTVPVATSPALPTPPGNPLPTATPPAPSGPTPTPTPICIANVCLDQVTTGDAGTTHTPRVTALSAPKIQLPDTFEQQLVTALKAAELANPQLLHLAGGHLAAPDVTLPYAAAEESGQAQAQAANSGVTLMVRVHAARVELFQGLITFGAIDSTLQGQAPGSSKQGYGTITTAIVGAKIAGIPVTIDQNGVQIDNQSGALTLATEKQLNAAINTALKAAGIQIALTPTTSSHDSGKWQGSGGGIQVTGEIAPGNGAPATHVNFTIGQVTGSGYAVGGSSFKAGSNGNDIGTGGGFCCFGGGSGSGSFGNTPSGSGSAPGTGAKGGLASIIGSMNGGEMLALLFVVQGCSTAAVAAAAHAAETAARAGAVLPVLETQ
ncbi:MAG: hypothetical protein ACM3N4_06215 [Nitrososphaerota archaeon]